MTNSGGFTIEIDTGGTFTDGYVTGEGRVVVAKADTTPYDLATGVLACIDHAAEQLELTRAELLRRTGIVRLSTTVGTNTLINRNGPAVGLLVGRDGEEVVRTLSPALPLERERVATVPDGDEAVDQSAVQRAVRSLLESGARVIVIVLSGGPGLAARELAVRDAIAQSYPRHYLGAVPVLPSHQVTAVADARLRMQTAVLNAYLHPVMSRFLYRVEDALRADGYQRPLLVANANGGTSRVAKTSALRTWGSGPAGGVSATATMARELDAKVAVGFDVGGTSTDIAVVLDGQWSYEVQPVIEDIEVALPVLSLFSAALGGGTIARVSDGELRLGPDSAGAQPGPACFGLGGEEATLTDAVCHLGLFDATNFLGGRKTLDVDAATEAVERGVAHPLGIDVDEAAQRVVEEAGRITARNLRARLEAAQLRPEDAVLFATGGAGGMLAAEVQRAFSTDTSSVPVHAFPVSSVFSAFGLSRLDTLHTYEIPADRTPLSHGLAEAHSRAVADMRAEGFPEEELVFRREAEFVDDAGDVMVIDVHPATADDDIAGLGPAGRSLRLVRSIASCPTRRAQLPRAGDGGSEPVTTRPVRWHRGSRETPVFDWLQLPEGSVVEGPAVLETTETTLAVPPDSAVTIGRLGDARFTRPQTPEKV